MGYTCKPNIGCYSVESQETHALFMGLQNLLNRFASGVRFKLLQVDGILGPASAAAAQKVCISLTQAGVSAQLRHDVAQMTPSTNTFEDLARNALAFSQFLYRAVTEIGLPAVPPPPKLAPTPTPANVGPAPDPGLPVATNHRRRTYVLTGLGALAAGLVLTGVYFAATRRKRAQPVAGHELVLLP